MYKTIPMIILCCYLLTACTTGSISQQRTTPTPTQAVIQAISLTHTNKLAHYSFSYPSQLRVEAIGEGGDAILDALYLFEGDEQYEQARKIYQFQKITLDAAVARFIYSPEQDILIQNETRIDGKKAIDVSRTYQTDGTEQTKYIRAIFIERLPDEIYSIETRIQDDPYIDQIISTFRFI